MMTQVDFEDLEFNPFRVKNTILLDNQKDPDIHFFNNDINHINTQYYSPDVNMLEITDTDLFSMLHLNIHQKHAKKL